MSYEPKIGDKVWIWHYGSLREITVKGIIKLSERLCVEYTGFCAADFWQTKQEAIEYMVILLCHEIMMLKDMGNTQILDYVENLVELAKDTLIALKASRTSVSGS